MQCNITIRKKDKGFQCIVSYKDGNRWRQKSKQGFETQKAAKIHAQTIIDELKKTITFSIDDSLKDLTLIQYIFKRKVEFNGQYFNRVQKRIKCS